MALGQSARAANPTSGNPSSGEQSCAAAGLSGNLLGLCRAYWEANQCDVLIAPGNKQACNALAANYQRLSGGKDIKQIFMVDGGGVVPSGGGEVSLSGVARAVFPAGAFAADTLVSLRTTSDPRIAADFEEFGGIFRPANRLAYELRIVTGLTPAQSPTIRVEISVPDAFSAAVPAGHQIELFAKLVSDGGLERFDEFNIFTAMFDSTAKSIVADVPTAIFSNTRNSAGTYEAILTLAPTPGINRMSSVVAPTAGNALLRSPSALAATISACKASSITCPVSGGCAVTSPFSEARTLNGVTKPHYGVDYRAATGTSILASESGTIERSYTSTTYGETLVMRHTNGSATLYAHLENRFVAEGVRVTKGQQIATSDNSGSASQAPHLHFEYVPNGQIIQSKDRIDPDACIDSLASGSITVSDNGNIADDAFEVYIDGVLIGATAVGASNTLAINNIIRGPHTLTIKVIIAPDNIGTYGIKLSDGLTFSDGSTSASGTPPQGASVSFTIIVP